VDTFAKLWTREIDEVPEFSTSRFHIITGLLLPIWKRLPGDNPRVYRFTTDDGERVIGRLIPADCLGQFIDRANPLTPEETLAALAAGRRVTLEGGMMLRRVSVMHAPRFELTGFAAAEVDSLKAKGLVSEIIAWKLRLFVPTGDRGATVLAKLMAMHPAIAAA
jgi:hypothetical protein